MKAIVITSIFNPTEAVKRFVEKTEYQVYVVGDKKTPQDWSCPNVRFISVAEQEGSRNRIAGLIPYNHYCRKMFGYLKAMEEGATLIIDMDDDNIPYDHWGFPSLKGTFDAVGSANYVNIYQLYTDQKIWPRGFPLRFVNNDNKWMESISIGEEEINIGIWQGLADEDPDVDAIYRLTNGRPCFFNRRAPIVLNKKTVCPFNTQNTLIREELFPLMYLPAFVTFRYTDILRGLVAQPIMWAHGYQLGFTDATVIQKRNEHDFYKDFLSEIPMYETAEKVVEIVSATVSPVVSIYDNLYNSYLQLFNAGIVEKQELINLEAWIEDSKNCRRNG